MEKKQQSRRLVWCFTIPLINVEKGQLLSHLQKISKDFIFQAERGISGYEHYQGYMSLVEKARLEELKKMEHFSGAHFEFTKGSKQNNIDYCSKADTRTDGPWYSPSCKPKRKLEFNFTLYEWQIKLLKILNEIPDNRTIYWYYGKAGNEGKTTFAKYLVVNMNAGYVSGKGNDIKCYASLNDKEIYIFDYPRSNENFVSYQALEEIKNGIYFSGKYEPESICRPCPHVVVFANFLPDMEKLSKDRWVIVEL